MPVRATCIGCGARIGHGVRCAPCFGRAVVQQRFSRVHIGSDGSACTNVGRLQLWLEQLADGGWAVYGDDGFYIRLLRREDGLRALERLASRTVAWADLACLKEPYTAGQLAAAPEQPPVDRGNGLGED